MAFSFKKNSFQLQKKHSRNLIKVASCDLPEKSLPGCQTVPVSSIDGISVTWTDLWGFVSLMMENYKKNLNNKVGGANSEC